MKPIRQEERLVQTGTAGLLHTTKIKRARSHRDLTPKCLAAAAAITLGAAVPALAQQTDPGSQGTAKAPAIQVGPLTLTFGGFTELATIYRNRNEVSDVGSDFNGGIPFTNNPLSHESEFRESARQSRFSLLAQGAPWAGARAELYMETDFLSAGVTSNSRESNSYTLRMRHFYGRLITNFGMDITAGQTWSLATLAKNAGLAPRDQITPLTIDAQYVVGFNWTRNPQLRIVQRFSKQYSLGLSIESPQVVTSGGSNTSTNAPPYPSANFTNPGDSAGLLNSTTTYSTDTRPDIILKAAADPGWGHYEIYGLARWFTSNVAREPETSSGGGVGAGMILPLAPGLLSFQLSGLAGKGIGRYGSVQLPDVAEGPNGQISPIKAYQILAGLTFTPTPTLTAYAYLGREKASATFWQVPGADGALFGYGYGAPEFNVSGCEVATGTTCQANTQQVDEVTVGDWWKFYTGRLGNFRFGLQFAYLQRDAFAGIGNANGPSANIFIGMASFRYYPYQR